MHSSALVSTTVTHSILMGLPKSGLSAIQSVLMLLQDLPIFPSVWLKSYTGSRLPLVLNSRSSSLSPNLNLALPQLHVHVSHWLYAQTNVFSICPPSTDRLYLFVPRVRTALAQCRAFAVSGSSSWNGPPLLRAKLMSGISTTSCRSLIIRFFPSELPRWKRLWIANTARGAL